MNKIDSEREKFSAMNSQDQAKYILDLEYKRLALKKQTKENDKFRNMVGDDFAEGTGQISDSEWTDTVSMARFSICQK